LSLAWIYDKKFQNRFVLVFQRIKSWTSKSGTSKSVAPKAIVLLLKTYFEFFQAKSAEKPFGCAFLSIFHPHLRSFAPISKENCINCSLFALETFQASYYYWETFFRSSSFTHFSSKK